MGSICQADRTHRREHHADAGETTRQVHVTHRRRLPHQRYDGVSMCGHQKMVLQHETSQNQAGHDGGSSSTKRMEGIKGTHSTTPLDLSSADNSRTVLVSSRPLQPGGCFDVCKLSSLSFARNVRFNDSVTVYEPYDWSPDVYRAARKGYWMQAALDRHRFKRRIRETEDVIGYIFNLDHRDSIKHRFM